MTGPTWISDPEFVPQCPDLHSVPNECLAEGSPCSSSPLTQSTHQGEAILNCEHVSTLGRLLKVTARGMKFIILKTKIKSASLMAADFEGAEMYWVTGNAYSE